MRIGSSAVCRTVVRRFAPFHNSRSSTIAFRPNMAVRLGAFSSVCCSHAMHSAAFNTSVRRFHGGETQDYYATLGVKPDATQDEIKAAYKKLALEFHPDRNHEPGAEDKFKNISAAYNVVGHRDKRREYDMQRNAFGGGGPRGGGGGPSSQGYAAPGFSSQAGGGYPGGYQQMSKEEADRLFREIFGGMRVDQIFRNLEDEMRRGNMRSPHGGLGHSVGQTFAPGQQVFRPFFSTTSESTKVYTDAFGNRMEEHTYVDPRGRRFTVRKQSSTDPNASTNQTPEDYDSSHASSRDGRVHLGKVSRSFEKPNTDFTENFFGVRSHGRNPFVGMALIVAWAVVLGTLLYCTLYFFLNHPFFSLAVIFLVMAGRRGRF